MTCVLGMVVRREREIRNFVKTPFYRVISTLELAGKKFDGEWRVTPQSSYFQYPKLYKENGFLEKKDAQELIHQLNAQKPLTASVEKIEKKKEKKNPPLLFNLAELQNVCSKLFKISPDETLRIAQELYEKKLITYPRTDARVLSTAAAKVVGKNLNGLKGFGMVSHIAAHILEQGEYKNLSKSRYVNDKQVTDHYALIPTGQGLGALGRLPVTSQRVYEIIVRRFLSIFYPPAIYQKIALTTKIQNESFFSSFKVLLSPGYLEIAGSSFAKKSTDTESSNGEATCDVILLQALQGLKKSAILPVEKLAVKEGETSPPKRYNSGTMILAMENAGQLIEDEELRAQIKGSGIGTSATRAEILKKLFHIEYLNLNKKTQVITPTLLGEMIYDVVNCSIRSLLNPELTASWEKGLTYVAEGSITPQEYMDKLENFIRSRTEQVMGNNFQYALRQFYDLAAQNYPPPKTKKGSK